MLQRKQIERVHYEHSQLLGKLEVPHGFLERNGGVSPEPYASLNLKYGIGDDKTHVDVNYETIYRLFDLDQDTHTKLMAENKDQIVINPEPGLLKGYDAAIFTSGSVSITAADCSSVLIVHREPDVCAIVHAGWYGVTRRIVERVMQELIDRYQIDAKNCVAAIGPTIQADNYEIQDDVAGEVKAHLPVDAHLVLKYRDKKTYLDIPKALVLQLQRMGVVEYEISETDTFENDDFFSYRRDGNPTGRHGIFLKCPQA